MNAQIDVAVLAEVEEIQPAKALVWDLPVRIFHWALAASVVTAFVTHQLGVDYFEYHRWSGYTVIVLLVFRLIWGFVGPKHARFLQFVRGPKATWQYARKLRNRQAPHSAGHNPLGALMVLVLLGGFLVQAVAGLFADDQIFNTGPLQPLVSGDVSLGLTTLHRTLFYWLAGAIALHVAAVLAHWLLWKDNLVTAMFSGRKRHLSPADGIPSSRLGLALAVVVLVGASFAWLLGYVAALTQ